MSLGVIRGFYPIVNTPKLGYTYCRLTLIFENADKEKQEEIISWLNNDPRWFWIFKTHGVIDVLAVMWAKNMTEFYNAVNDLMNRYGEYIREREENIAVNVIHFQQRFLLGSGHKKRIELKETKDII
jgi:DNA-binding Lrp family transcriptional regulator